MARRVRRAGDRSPGNRSHENRSQGNPSPAGTGPGTKTTAAEAAAWRQWYDRWIEGEAAVDVWVGAHLDAAHLAARREERLACTVTHAVRCSPFYRRHWRRCPDPVAGFASLPIMTRALLTEHFDDVVTDPLVTRAGLAAFLADANAVGESFLGRYAVWTSSGTTGTPGIFVHDPHALAVYDALEAVRFRRLASLPALMAEAIAPARYALVGATGSHFAGAATVERLRRMNPWLAARMTVISVMQPLGAVVDALNAFQPTLVATYPSAARLLSGEQRAGRLRLTLHELWTGGETLTAQTRDEARTAFGCPVRDDYGASEFLPIAWQCDLGALHLNADWVVLEPVDAEHRPVPDDVPSHTALLTNLANRVQPLVRYDLGDGITRHAAPCACGCALPVISVSGRADDVLALAAPDGRTVPVLPLALTTIVEDVTGNAPFQIVQTDAARLVIRLPPLRDTVADRDRWHRLHDAVVAWLRTLGVARVTIARDLTPPVHDRGSGKLRHVVRRLAPPNAPEERPAP